MAVVPGGMALFLIEAVRQLIRSLGPDAGDGAPRGDRPEAF